MDTLKLIADNPTLLEAVKAVIVKQFDLDGLSTSLADESLGQLVRARIEGLQRVEAGFKEIATHKTVKQEALPPMPAR